MPSRNLQILLLLLCTLLTLLLYFTLPPAPTTIVAIATKDRVRQVNRIVTEYDEDAAARLRTLIARKASSRDLELISLVRDLLDPPSTHLIKLSRAVMKTPQATQIDLLMKEKTNGFFIECGALDGERSSNTLYLERDRGWRGLLIEMDPYFYTQLRGKNRHSYSLNACLSPHDYPLMMDFQESTGGLGKLLPPDVVDKSTKDGVAKMPVHKVPCFPLETILLAVNQTSVDYFSLDVEGLELDVLRTIPFDRLNINTLSVEWDHIDEGKAAVLKYMADKGYEMNKDIVHNEAAQSLFVADYIFVKRS